MAAIAKLSTDESIKIKIAMKIDTGKEVLNLKGEAYKADGEPLRVGHVIAEALGSNPAGGKMKMYLLAEAAYKNPSLEVDAADFAIIKNVVEACTSYNNIIVGQVLNELESVK